MPGSPPDDPGVSATGGPTRAPGIGCSIASGRDGTAAFGGANVASGRGPPGGPPGCGDGPVALLVHCQTAGSPCVIDDTGHCLVMPPRSLPCSEPPVEAGIDHGGRMAGPEAPARHAPLRVAFVASVFPNRSQPVLGTFNAERALASSRYAAVRVIAPVPWFPRGLVPAPRRWRQWAEVPRRAALRGIPIDHARRFVVPWVGDAVNGALYERALAAALDRAPDVDVIDAQFVWPDGFAAVEQGRKRGIPVCVTAHGSDLTWMPRFPAIRRQIVSTLRGATRVMTVSRHLAELAIALGAEPAKVAVVPNGVDPRRFRPRDRDAVRKLLGLAPGGRVVLGVGALTTTKGFELLVPAVSRLHRRGLDVQLVLVGDGPRRKRIESAARSLPPGSIRLVGEQPHDTVALYMAAADVLVLPSEREGWPTVFYEAWACGTPVVAARYPGCQEAVSEPVGVLVDGRGAAALGDGIERALVRDWRAAELVRHARARTWAQVARETLVCLREAVRCSSAHHASCSRGER